MHGRVDGHLCQVALRRDVAVGRVDVLSIAPGDAAAGAGTGGGRRPGGRGGRRRGRPRRTGRPPPPSSCRRASARPTAARSTRWSDQRPDVPVLHGLVPPTGRARRRVHRRSNWSSARRTALDVRAAGCRLRVGSCSVIWRLPAVRGGPVSAAAVGSASMRRRRPRRPARKNERGTARISAGPWSHRPSEGPTGRADDHPGAGPRARRGRRAGAGVRGLPHGPALPRGRHQRRVPVPARPRGGRDRRVGRRRASTRWSRATSSSSTGGRSAATAGPADAGGTSTASPPTTRSSR